MARRHDPSASEKNYQYTTLDKMCFENVRFFCFLHLAFELALCVHHVHGQVRHFVQLVRTEGRETIRDSNAQQSSTYVLANSMGYFHKSYQCFALWLPFLLVPSWSN